MEVKDPPLEDGDFAILVHRHENWRVLVFDNHDHPIGVFENLRGVKTLGGTVRWLKREAAKNNCHLEPEPGCHDVVQNVVRN